MGTSGKDKGKRDEVLDIRGIFSWNGSSLNWISSTRLQF